MTEQEENLKDGYRERFTLRKSAKLRHRTMVEGLFANGRSVYAGPLRVTFRVLSSAELAGSFREEVPDRIGPVQVMITVPKKKRRHAVDRVLMRRRIREAFRRQYHPLRRVVENDPQMRTLSLAVIYLESSNLDSGQISAAMASAITKIIRKLSSQNNSVQTQES